MSNRLKQLERRMEAFERAWNYDESYMRDLLRAGPEIRAKFYGVTLTIDERAVPKKALFVVQTLAVLERDCESCVQNIIDDALAKGVDPGFVRAVLTGDETSMGDDARLGFRFASASLAQDVAGLEPHRVEILARWGEQGLVALATAITVGRMYATLKYPLGEGHPCVAVRVAGEVVPLRRQASAT